MDSEIKYDKDGQATSFQGPEAVEVFRAAVLATSIGLLEKGIVPTRGMTMKKVLAMCEPYTGKKYKRTESETAVKDLRVWIELMKSSIPSTTGE